MIKVTLLVTIVASATAFAQTRWQIDSNTSVATLATGSGGDLFKLGVARVSGEILLGQNESVSPALTFTINPGSAPWADHAKMCFSSERSVLTATGKLLVTGNLSVIRVERTATHGPNEAYAGPRYSNPRTKTYTRVITLVFPGYRIAAQRSGTRISGSTTVAREEFPELLESMRDDVWSSQLVNDEKCTGRSTVGEDYHGGDCKGTVIATADNCAVQTGASNAKDFQGCVPLTAPDGNKATVVLDLNLKKVPVSVLASARMTKVRGGTPSEDNGISNSTR